MTELTIRDAAAKYQLSEKWIRVNILQGNLPAKKDETGTWVIQDVDLDAWRNSKGVRPRGHAATSGLRYIVTIPPDKHDQLVRAIRNIEGATLRRNKHKDYLIGGNE